MLDESVKLLLIDDSEEDTLLLIQLLNSNCIYPNYTRIETSGEMVSELNKSEWDLIISDHNLATFSSINALEILKKFNSDIPLIVLSGGIDQNVAVDSMRKGARDYIMKEDTIRLIPAIEREIREYHIRKEALITEIRNKKNLQGMMDHTLAIIYIKDTLGHYTFVNQRFENVFKINVADVIGKTNFEIFPQEIAEKLHLNDEDVLKVGHALESEEIAPHDDGLHTYVSTKFPLFDENEKISAVCSISTDITDRKLQDEQLRRSQKMDAIGQLSGGIAHDFNNQLGIVIGYLDFLRNYFQDKGKQNKWVVTASKATLRCMDLTRQLLSFSRRKPIEKSIVDINETFDDIETVISRSVTPEVEISYNKSKKLWLTEIDKNEFQDVLLNLIINARDAIPAGGSIFISTNNIYLDENFVSHNTEVKCGEYVQLIVKDTGMGMSQSTIERIFEPFFTTKSDGKGTGLGLSMVYGFVNRYQGHIKVYSKPEKGTSFHIYLPRSKAKKSNIKVKAEHLVELPGGKEHILIVDDERLLLDLASEYLTGLGYKICMAENALKALDILAKKNIDLLFTDIVMPGGVNGYVLAEKAKSIKPNLKVLLTSGYTSKNLSRNVLSSFSDNLLSKPYRKADLAQRVRMVLDQGLPGC